VPCGSSGKKWANKTRSGETSITLQPVSGEGKEKKRCERGKKRRANRIKRDPTTALMSDKRRITSSKILQGGKKEGRGEPHRSEVKDGTHRVAVITPKRIVEIGTVQKGENFLCKNQEKVGGERHREEPSFSDKKKRRAEKSATARTRSRCCAFL